jgi:hypothetical protein
MRINPKAVSVVLVPAVNMWSSTLRYRRHNYLPISRRREEKRPVVFAIWHDEMFPLFHLHRGEKVTAVVSASDDGEILAQFMARMGYGLARGSSSRFGLRALKTAAQVMDQGRDIIFTVDGPTGPRHTAKPGAVYLAARFKAEIVPVRVGMPQKYVFSKSWDKFCLPLPFSRIDVHYGDPYIPGGEISTKALENQSRELENKLNSLL